MAAVELKHVHLLKAALVEEQVNSLAGCEFALCVLLFDSFLATAQSGYGALFYKLLDVFLLFGPKNKVLVGYCCLLLFVDISYRRRISFVYKNGAKLLIFLRILYLIKGK